MDDSTSIEEDEVSRLRRELRVVRMEMEDLIDETIDSQHELESCHRIQREICGLRKPFLQPPPEILYMIFERTIPPLILLDSSVSLHPESLFCQVLRQKKSIVNVCRMWNTVGLPLLYMNIFVRRVHQLLNLLRTLVILSPNSGSKEMIKTVDICCHIPRRYLPQFQLQLKALFDRCPRLTSCAFRTGQQQLPFTTLSCAAVPNITNLTLNHGIKLNVLENILQSVSHHVLSLSFHIPHSDFDSESTVSHLNTDFLHLEEITIWASDTVSENMDALLCLWKIPRLKRLTFRLNCNGGHLFPKTTLKRFCDFHGRNLRYLHILLDCTWLPSSWPAEGHDILFPDLSKSCPALEHIVLSPGIPIRLAHKRIEWVDIWAAGAVDFDPEQLRSTTQEAEFPALKGVRVLPFYLRDEYSFHLPLYFPPNLVATPADAFACQFLGIGIQHDVGEIRYIQTGWPVEAIGEDDGNDIAFDKDEDGSDEDGLYSPFVHHDSEDSDSECGDGDESSDWSSGDEMDALETDFPWLGGVEGSTSK